MREIISTKADVVCTFGFAWKTYFRSPCSSWEDLTAYFIAMD